MKNRIIAQTLSILALITSGVASSQTQVPNTFQSGQPARAAEVNDNFSTVESAVNQNASDIANNTAETTSNTALIQANATAIAVGEAAILANTQAIAGVAAIAIPRVKANGQDIGTFLTLSHDPSSENLFNTGFWILSDTGYVFRVSASDRASFQAGELQLLKLRFETPNCSGPAYVAAMNNPAIPLTALLRSGAVFASEDLNDNPGVYYTPKGSALDPVVLQSFITIVSGATVCTAQNEAGGAFIVVPNDSSVTGVQSQHIFDPPITLGVQTIQVPVP